MTVNTKVPRQITVLHNFKTRNWDAAVYTNTDDKSTKKLHTGIKVFKKYFEYETQWSILNNTNNYLQEDSMKKIRVVALVSALLATMLLGACSKENKPDSLPIVPMGAEEIAEAEQAFYVSMTVDGEMRINPANCFLTSYYDSVDKLDLQAFLRYFPGSELGTEQEFEALKNFGDWPFSQCEKLSDMPVPLNRYKGEAVRAALEKYAGISLEQLDYKNAPGVYYLEEYDAFYNYTSDFGLEPLRCVRGERQGERLYLYCERWEGLSLLTADKNGDGYTVISHQLLEKIGD